MKYLSLYQIRKMNTNTELLPPCPACGGEMEVYEDRWIESGDTVERVKHARTPTAVICPIVWVCFKLNPFEWRQFITQIESRAAAQWVAIEDELPPLDAEVVTVFQGGGIDFGNWYDGAHWRYNEDGVMQTLRDGAVTHWLKLNPTAIPKGGE